MNSVIVIACYVKKFQYVSTNYIDSKRKYTAFEYYIQEYYS